MAKTTCICGHSYGRHETATHGYAHCMGTVKGEPCPCIGYRAKSLVKKQKYAKELGLHAHPEISVKKNTSRGFGMYDFTDRYEQKCTLQKSSLATEDCIWLGVNNSGPQMGNKDIDHGRMHLSQEQVEALLPILKKFVKTGDI